MTYLKGSGADLDSEKVKEETKIRLEIQERRKTILKSQYEKSVEAIGMIKQYLQEVFEEIGVDRETIEKLSKILVT